MPILLTLTTSTRNQKLSSGLVRAAYYITWISSMNEWVDKVVKETLANLPLEKERDDHVEKEWEPLRVMCFTSHLIHT
eukprot:scaffold6143_cov147-Skeletonema_dohrnii-CCMP3373.AAC.7